MQFHEVLTGMRTKSELMILDFKQIPADLPDYKNIQRFFAQPMANGQNPRTPENRQVFNDNFLHQTGAKYLIGRYCEDRLEMLRGSQIAAEGRTIHLGVDLFTTNLEPVHAPADGVIIVVGREPETHSYGNYVIIEHNLGGEILYTFYGHLANDVPEVGRKVIAGEVFAKLGDYLNNENGGWSRHLHFQLLTDKPSQTQAPIGYSTPANLAANRQKFPDPNRVLQLLVS